MDVWPSTLPQELLRRGYRKGFAENRIRSRTDTGPAKVRRRSTAAVRPLGGVIHVTQAQLDLLEVFFTETLAEGSLPFLFPDPHGGAALTVRFGEELPEEIGIGPDLFELALAFEVLP